MKLPVTKRKSSQIKNKGKSKSSTYKISLDKLNNKKNNRLAKQGKLKRKPKKKKRKDQNADDNINETKEKEQKTPDKNVDDNSIDESGSDSEEQIDPEDTSDFIHLNNAWNFANADLSLKSDGKPKAKKRKREEDEEGEKYEQGARTFASELGQGDMKMMLPIIDKGKVIKQMAKKEEFDKTDQDKSNKTENAEVTQTENKDKPADDSKKNGAKPKKDDAAFFKTLNSTQLLAYRNLKLSDKKVTISALSHAILEDPQNNIGKLKELRLLLGASDLGVSLTVRKYAMVSLMEVFKDIVPGYRMRIPSENELSTKLKDDTKSLLDYEAAFLLNYRIYLEFLETMAKVKQIPKNSFLTKHGIHHLKMPASSAIEMGALAVKCMSEMLVNHPHFNYRDQLINSVVHFTNHGRPEYSNSACDALKRVFRQDKKGDTILEIVKSIGRKVKRLNYNVRPQVLLTFLALKIKEVDMSSVSQSKKKMERAERMKRFSRRERKTMKMREKLDKELLETKATEEKSVILKLHTEIIQSVFETYIRVIKLASDSELLGPVLEGLAQFAHLINLEYFDSLFAAFTRLIESGDLTTKETLHCIQTAFTILSGQGSVLNIDPTGFYRHLYAALLDVQLGSSEETAPIVIECLDVMISKRKKQVSQQRVLAFMKRLCSLCLHQAPETIMGYLSSVRNFLHNYKHADVLVDVDVRGSGVYLPLLEDPEHCCANNTSLWELHLLRHHYEPEVKKYSHHLLKGAPLTGEHQIPIELSRISAKELYKVIHKKEIFNEKIPKKCGKRKRFTPNGFLDANFEDYTSAILASVESFEKEDSKEEENNLMDVS